MKAYILQLFLLLLFQNESEPQGYKKLQSELESGRNDDVCTVHER